MPAPIRTAIGTSVITFKAHFCGSRQLLEFIPGIRFTESSAPNVLN